MRTLVAALVVSTGCFAKPSEPADIDTGLVAHWPLDDGGTSPKAHDTARGNDGTLVGGAVWTTARNGHASLTLNGSAYVTIPHDYTGELGGGVTLAIWENVTNVATSASQRLISSYYYMAGAPPMLDGEFYVEIDDTSVNCGLHVGGQWDSISKQANVPTVDDWHHIACSYDSHAILIYVDGQQMAVAAATGSLSSSGLAASHFPVTLGASVLDTSAQNQMTGALSDARIYDHALAPAAVAALAKL